MVISSSPMVSFREPVEETDGGGLELISICGHSIRRTEMSLPSLMTPFGPARWSYSWSLECEAPLAEPLNQRIFERHRIYKHSPLIV